VSEIFATSKIVGEETIYWLEGAPPDLSWIRYATSRRGPIKVGSRTIAYGWSTIVPESQKRNLSRNVFLRRLFYRKRSDYNGPAPFNAVNPRSIKVGVPGTRVGVKA